MEKITFTKVTFVLTWLFFTAAGFSQTQSYTSNGSFTVPAGVTSITVEAWGGGGRGSTVSTNIRGGGGGGGAYARKVISVTPGAVHTVNVGGGSSAATTGGGDSWFISNTTILAKGGSSSPNNNTNGAPGGSDVNSIGDVKYAGGYGANGNATSSGGGGSSAGTNAAGNTGGTPNGAIAPTGGGAGGNGTNSNADGSDGFNPGGGGGGARKSSGGTKDGGSGADGMIKVTWAIPEINVTGNGITVVDGDGTPATPDGTDFGTVDYLSGTITKTFTIHNTGTLDLTISAVNPIGADAADFTIIAAPASVVAPSGSTTFTVSFDPSTPGTKNARIDIFNNDFNESPYTFSIRGIGSDAEINLQGNSTDIVNGDLTPSTADWTHFGGTDTAVGTIQRTFTIQNTSAATRALGLGAITISGANASDFSVTAAPASSIAIGSQTTFTITFNPSATGLHSALISIANDDSDENPYTFAVNGVGSDVEINLQGNSVNIVDGDTTPSVTDATEFGSTDVMSGSITKTYTIYNLNTATMDLSVGAITISGAAAASFSVTSPPAASVPVGGSTTFTVTFNPTTGGTQVATISIANDDGDENPYDFAVHGTGTDPEISVRGNAVGINDGDTTPTVTDWTDFGATSISGGTITRTFTVYNLGTGTMPLTIGAITITGTNAAEFTVTLLPSSPLAVNANTTFQVTFNPSATGLRSAVINIDNNDSNETPFNYSIQGTGTDPEINIIGNLLTIADGDSTPSVSDNTDFGSASVDSGNTLITYTIQNTGVGVLTLGAITFTGPNAADFTVAVAPAATIAAGASTTFQVSFAPIDTGSKTASISIANDDTNENPYNFSITGLGVRTYPDTDGDTVSDNVDIDDDNDGVLDTLEQTYCALSPFATTAEYVFLNETFGAGTTRGLININIPGATCTYCYEDGIAGANTTACPSQTSWILDDGEYTVTHKIAGTTASDPDNIHGDLAWNGLVDHTVGDVNGRMAVFNASYTPGIFYETTISGIIPNVPITYSFYALNIMQMGNYSGSILPNITVEFLTTGGTILSTYNTGNIGRCSTNTATNTCVNSIWLQYTTSVNLGNNTAFVIRFKNNAPGGGGNDLAIDDITITQQYCDRDGDTISNIFDLDSDNDGISDIEEAGFKSLSGGKSIMSLNPALWLDADLNGLHDNIDAMIAGGTYVLPDTDADGTVNYTDLDSDNDAVFDIDEAGVLNGDGDINGDGTGDGLDVDRDGILNIYDELLGYGTAARPFALDTDASGTPDFMQLDSNSDGISDIAATLYNTFDLNNDGKIDASPDVDKDGISDGFDTSLIAIGSPRNISKKLFLEFDGRNDYAEGPQMLGSLAQASMMGWIKLNSTLSTPGFLMGQDNFNLKISNASGNTLTATAKGVTISYSTNMAADRWYHVAVVYDGVSPTEKLKLYVNGDQVTTSNDGTLAGTLNASTLNFTMGKTPGALTDYFKGSVDEARVFNTALSSDQVQKMVYQEIKKNGTAIRGESIPKDIELALWSNLIGYFRMDNFKDDVIDNLLTAAIDAGTASNYTRIYNVKTLSGQLAPMPFITAQAGAIDAAVSQSNFVNGADILTYDWSIVNIKHQIDLPFNSTDLGMIIDPAAKLTLSNNNALKNSWYLKLNGKIDLQGKSQLIQTATSDLDPTSTGRIERDQQGTANKFNYNYWASPVSTINATTNNTSFTVAGVMKDGSNPAVPADIVWTTGLNGSATAPITLSNYWIFKFQNVTNNYSNWSSVGSTGSLMPAQGFTLKGSSAAGASQNYVFVGKPNNGAITTAIAANNLNLSGNPYPSAMDADKFINDNLASISGTLYFWEHFSTNNTHNLADYQGGYAARTLVGGIAPVSPTEVSNLGASSRIPGRFIPVGQGFFITGSPTGGTVTFNNSQRAFIREDNVLSNFMFRNEAATVAIPSETPFNNDEDVVETVEYPKIRIGFNAGNYHRQALLGFMGTNATPALDRGYDAIHIDSQPNDMYFMHASNKLIIQGDGFFHNGKIYPLGIKTVAAGMVEFTLDSIENFDESQQIYIKDNVTGIYHNIKNGPVQLDLPSGTIENRFSLRFTDGVALGVDDNNLENGIYVAYANTQEMLNIKNNIVDTTVESVTLYTILGQTVFTCKVDNTDQLNIMIPVTGLSTGTYIVKIKTSNGEISKKIAVK